MYGQPGMILVETNRERVVQDSKEGKPLFSFSSFVFFLSSPLLPPGEVLMHPLVHPACRSRPAIIFYVAHAAILRQQSN